jgi:hypothetical protein
MISRLTACAALFAVLATTGLAFAAEAHQHPARHAAPSAPLPVITLPRVEIVGKRAPRS